MRPREELARLAIDGDRDALDGLVRALQGDLYDSSKRSYLHPVAGSDAAKIGAGLFTTPGA